MALSHEKFVEQRSLLIEGLTRVNDTSKVLLVSALILIADELHTANERERGAGVFRDCLLACLKEIATAIYERKL